jgi:probable HAF family extracellular repeat protein
LGGVGSRSQANGINDAGQVVGLFNDNDDHGFYWTAAGGMVALPTLSGIESAARAINSAGQLAGYGDIATGDAHAVVWNAASNSPTAAQQIDALEASIQGLVAAGSLRPNQANTLIIPLRNAERSLAAGQPRLACFQVFQFQVAVTRLILFRALTFREGLALIETAADIQTTIGC